MKKKGNEIFLECERHWVFYALIFVGGFYGGYTFSVRGGVFCNAQTANVVLFSMYLGLGNFWKAAYFLIPMSAYLLGTVLSEILAKTIKHYRIIRWDTMLVGIEVMVCLILGLLPKSAPDQICQVTLNFICAMQFNTFRQSEGIPMATTFVTNHIRQTGSNLVKAIRDHDKMASKKWKSHAGMIGSFALGACLAAFLSRFMDVRTILALAPVNLFILIKLAYADIICEHKYIEMTPHGH